MTIQLRDYQLPFMDGIRDAYKHGAKSVMGVAPCGFGKTVAFSYMTRGAVDKGNTVGLVAHRSELLDQIGGTLSMFDIPHGYVAPGRYPNPLAPAQVCSVQAMARRIDRYTRDPFDFLIEDEAHHCAAGTSHHAVAIAHRNKRILGVTATPERLSGEALADTYETMVLGPTPAELISTGALSRFRAYAPSAPDMDGISRRAGDFNRQENEGLMDKPTITGSAVEHYSRLAWGKKAVAFCVSIEHAEHVAQQFRDAGIPSASLDGKMERTVRREILRQFVAGKIWVLTSCDLISEGYDCPGIEVAILLRPTDSLSLFIQQVMRALRAVYADGFDLFREMGRLQAIEAGTKQFAIILDHAGNIARHGMPDDDRVWSLEGKKGRPKSGGSSVSTTVCGQCWFTFRPTAGCCPNCGNPRDIHGRQIAVVDGTLEEIDPDLVRQARAEKQATDNRRVQQTRDLPGLARLAVELGYNAGWIFHKHKARGNPSFPYGEAVKAFANAQQEVKNEQRVS